MALSVLTAAALTACGAGSPSTLDTHGPGPDTVARLWWFMFAIAAFVVLLVSVLLLVGVIPWRGRRAAPQDTPRWTKVMVVAGGVVFPLIVLSVLWVLTLHDMAAISEPAAPTAFEVQVTGHQWWWEVRYPTLGIVDANEIHIPVGRPVRLILTTGDVNHSFWVPQIMGKMDMVAGVTNQSWMQADRAGVYRGQCAEYCGLQHANMIFFVVAEPQADFDAWAAAAAAPAAAPASAEAVRGREVFLSEPCAACHTIQGVSEAPSEPGLEQFGQGQPFTAVRGPDLTHLASRRTLGAGAVENSPGNLAAWVSDARFFKPDVRMPPIPLSAEELRALVAYLQTLT